MYGNVHGAWTANPRQTAGAGEVDWGKRETQKPSARSRECSFIKKRGNVADLTGEEVHG